MSQCKDYLTSIGFVYDPIIKFEGKDCRSICTVIFYSRGEAQVILCGRPKNGKVFFIGWEDKTFFCLRKEIIIDILKCFAMSKYYCMELKIGQDDVIKCIEKIADCSLDEYEDENFKFAFGIINHGQSKEFMLNGSIPINSLIYLQFNLLWEASINVAKTKIEQIQYYSNFFVEECNTNTQLITGVCEQATEHEAGVILTISTNQTFYMKTDFTRLKYSEPASALNLLDVLLQDVDNVDSEEKGIKFGYARKEKQYWIVCPLYGLQIEDDLSIGNLTLIREVNMPSTALEPLLDGGREPLVYACASVQGTTAVQAISIYKEKLDLGIMFLTLILKDDSLNMVFNTSSILNRWQISNINGRLSYGEKVYVEDFSANSRQVFSFDKGKQSTNLTIDKLLIQYFQSDSSLEELMFNGNKSKKHIIQSLQWLVKSHYDDDSTSKIIYAYTAVEFLVKKEKGSTMREELINSMSESIGGEDAIAKFDAFYNKAKSLSLIEGDVNLNNRLEGILNGAFSGNGSIHSKLAQLLLNLDYKFDDVEWELFDKLKKHRQSIIHGKKIKDEQRVSESDLNKLYYMFSKLAIAALLKE